MLNYPRSLARSERKVKKMKTQNIKKKGNRHGKHREDKVNFGGMVTPEFKAFAQLVASKAKCGLMELMVRGINTIATEVGIMANGRVVPEYQDAIDAMAEIIRFNLAGKRGEV